LVAEVSPPALPLAADAQTPAATTVSVPEMVLPPAAPAAPAPYSAPIGTPAAEPVEPLARPVTHIEPAP